jgi:type IV secretion system protein VirB10
VAKKPDSAAPSAEQEALVKGKTPRNAIMSIGILAAVVIGGLGFYYELQATSKADEEARLKKATALKSSTEAPAANSNDIDQMIRQQREAAAAEAAARAASDAAAAQKAPVKPMLTGADFKDEVDKGGDTRDLSRRAAQDAIYTASVFKQAGSSRNATQAAGLLPAGVPSLEGVRAARAAAGSAGADALALALAKQGQAPEDRDRAFLNDAAARGGIERTTFNGRSTGCTLTPPHTILR